MHVFEGTWLEWKNLSTCTFEHFETFIYRCVCTFGRGDLPRSVFFWVRLGSREEVWGPVGLEVGCLEPGLMAGSLKQGFQWCMWKVHIPLQVALDSQACAVAMGCPH